MYRHKQFIANFSTKLKNRFEKSTDFDYDPTDTNETKETDEKKKNEYLKPEGTSPDTYFIQKKRRKTIPIPDDVDVKVTLASASAHRDQRVTSPVPLDVKSHSKHPREILSMGNNELNLTRPRYKFKQSVQPEMVNTDAKMLNYKMSVISDFFRNIRQSIETMKADIHRLEEKKKTVIKTPKDIYDYNCMERLIQTFKTHIRVAKSNTYERIYKEYMDQYANMIQQIPEKELTDKTLLECFNRVWDIAAIRPVKKGLGKCSNPNCTDIILFRNKKQAIDICPKCGLVFKNNTLISAGTVDGNFVSKSLSSGNSSTATPAKSSEQKAIAALLYVDVHYVSLNPKGLCPNPKGHHDRVHVCSN